MSLPAAGAAQLPSESQPVWIADERTLIGSYRFDEGGKEGMKIAVDLKSDHTATYGITTGASDADFIRAVGVWTLQGDAIHIHNTPGPVRLVSAGEPVRDASVGLSIVTMNADGTPADGLGVTWQDAHGLYALSEGRHVTGKGETIEASEVEVMRVADRKVLQTIALKRGGANSFRFTYYPSDEEPFDIAAIALDDRAEVIEVEVGTSQAKLARVRR